MNDPRTPEQIEAELVLQREQVAHTVDALAAKLDVKSRARDRANHLKDSATTPTGAPRPELLAVAAAVLAVTVGVALWRHRRTR